MDRSVMDRTANVSWSGILGTLHQSIRKAVFDAGRAGTGSRNAKGDDVKVFDVTANDAALDVLRKLQLPLVVVSEESGHQENCRLPVVAVTAFAMKGDEEKFRDGGCEAYIAKPISVAQFVDTVKRFVA